MKAKKRELFKLIEIGDGTGVKEILIEESTLAVQTFQGHYPAQVAVEKGFLHLLVLLYSFDPTVLNCRFGNDNDTLLHLAAAKGFCDIIEFLTSVNRDSITQFNNVGHSSMFSAAINGQLEALQLLVRLRRALIYFRSNRGESISHVAVGACQVKILRYLGTLEPDLLTATLYYDNGLIYAGRPTPAIYAALLSQNSYGEFVGKSYIILRFLLEFNPSEALRLLNYKHFDNGRIELLLRFIILILSGNPHLHADWAVRRSNIYLLKHKNFFNGYPEDNYQPINKLSEPPLILATMIADYKELASDLSKLEITTARTVREKLLRKIQYNMTQFLSGYKRLCRDYGNIFEEFNGLALLQLTLHIETGEVNQAYSLLTKLAKSKITLGEKAIKLGSDIIMLAEKTVTAKVRLEYYQKAYRCFLIGGEGDTFIRLRYSDTLLNCSRSEFHERMSPILGEQYETLLSSVSEHFHKNETVATILTNIRQYHSSLTGLSLIDVGRIMHQLISLYKTVMYYAPRSDFFPSKKKLLADDILELVFKLHEAINEVKQPVEVAVAVFPTSSPSWQLPRG